jgi:dihydrofolate reductase
MDLQADQKVEMDWIKVDSEMFDLVGQYTAEADTALYGRITWQMMNAYWPTAADQPNATKHDIQHSKWYNEVSKIVLSKSLDGTKTDKTTFIGNNIAAEIKSLKDNPGKNILIFGSPSAAHLLMEHNLIDEYWFFINPIVLGNGIPVFPASDKRIDLQQISSRAFPCGVTGIHYSVNS